MTLTGFSSEEDPRPEAVNQQTDHRWEVYKLTEDAPPIPPWPVVKNPIPIGQAFHCRPVWSGCMRACPWAPNRASIQTDEHAVGLTIQCFFLTGLRIYNRGDAHGQAACGKPGTTTVSIGSIKDITGEDMRVSLKVKNVAYNAAVNLPLLGGEPRVGVVVWPHPH